MDSDDRDNVVLCPNKKCGHVFSMAYLPDHCCPWCGTYFLPTNTFAGSAVKDELVQYKYAKHTRDTDGGYK